MYIYKYLSIYIYLFTYTHNKIKYIIHNIIMSNNFPYCLFLVARLIQQA